MTRAESEMLLELPGKAEPTWRDVIAAAPRALRAGSVSDAAHLHGVGQGGVHGLHRGPRHVFRLQLHINGGGVMTWQEAAQFS